MLEMEVFCINCGKNGHTYNQCKMPIISIGIVAFTNDASCNDILFLMIRRKDTLGFMDFMRGKYSLYNKEYILNLLKQMTVQEKNNLLTLSFDTLWKNIWCNNHISCQYKLEEESSKDKFNTLTLGILTSNGSYSLKELIEESNNLYEQWTEPEWGFPKGRRNYFEKDVDCALREFAEETGYSKKCLKNINNIQQYEEIFIGSNYKSYIHKYYVMKIENVSQYEKKQYDRSEVSKLEWKTYKEALDCIRHYNLEKKKILTSIYNSLKHHKLT